MQSLEYIHEQRGMKWVRVGMKIEVDGKPGVIKGGHHGNLAVLFNGDKETSNCHPTWKTRYFDAAGALIAIDGQLIATTAAGGDFDEAQTGNWSPGKNTKPAPAGG